MTSSLPISPRAVGELAQSGGEWRVIQSGVERRDFGTRGSCENWWAEYPSVCLGEYLIAVAVAMGNWDWVTLGWGLLVSPEATAETCTQCGQCEKACTQHLPIMERMKEMAAWEATE
jgi:ferredoxin